MTKSELLKGLKNQRSFIVKYYRDFLKKYGNVSFPTVEDKAKALSDTSTSYDNGIHGIPNIQPQDGVIMFIGDQADTSSYHKK